MTTDNVVNTRASSVHADLARLYICDKDLSKYSVASARTTIWVVVHSAPTAHVVVSVDDAEGVEAITIVAAVSALTLSVGALCRQSGERRCIPGCWARSAAGCAGCSDAWVTAPIGGRYGAADGSVPFARAWLPLVGGSVVVCVLASMWALASVVVCVLAWCHVEVLVPP